MSPSSASRQADSTGSRGAYIRHVLWHEVVDDPTRVHEVQLGSQAPQLRVVAAPLAGVAHVGLHTRGYSSAHAASTSRRDKLRRSVRALPALPAAAGLGQRAPAACRPGVVQRTWMKEACRRRRGFSCGADMAAACVSSLSRASDSLHRGCVSGHQASVCERLPLPCKQPVTRPERRRPLPGVGQGVCIVVHADEVHPGRVDALRLHTPHASGFELWGCAHSPCAPGLPRAHLQPLGDLRGRAAGHDHDLAPLAQRLSPGPAGQLRARPSVRHQHQAGQERGRALASATASEILPFTKLRRLETACVLGLHMSHLSMAHLRSGRGLSDPPPASRGAGQGDRLRTRTEHPGTGWWAAAA